MYIKNYLYNYTCNNCWQYHNSYFFQLFYWFQLFSSGEKCLKVEHFLELGGCRLFDYFYLFFFLNSFIMILWIFLQKNYDMKLKPEMYNMRMIIYVIESFSNISMWGGQMSWWVIIIFFKLVNPTIFLRLFPGQA
jgi:hypothetical protein